jgi:hypothetical protein
VSACRSGEASWWLAALLLALQASALRPHFLCWSCCPPLPFYVLLLVWSDCKQGLRRLRQGGWGYREARTRLPGWEGALGGLCSPGAAGRRGSAPAKKSAAATGSARTGGASPFLVHPKLGSEVTLGCGRHCVRFLPGLGRHTFLRPSRLVAPKYRPPGRSHGFGHLWEATDALELPHCPPAEPGPPSPKVSSLQRHARLNTAELPP